jgi:hypothetical protein
MRRPDDDHRIRRSDPTTGSDDRCDDQTATTGSDARIRRRGPTTGSDDRTETTGSDDRIRRPDPTTGSDDRMRRRNAMRCCEASAIMDGRRVS